MLELCDTLILHRQTGRDSLITLSKSLIITGTNAGGEIVATSLPTMPQGAAWAWVTGSERPVRIQVPAKQSLVRTGARRTRGQCKSHTRLCLGE